MPEFGIQTFPPGTVVAGPHNRSVMFHLNRDMASVTVVWTPSDSYHYNVGERLELYARHPIFRRSTGGLWHPVEVCPARIVKYVREEDRA